MKEIEISEKNGEIQCVKFLRGFAILTIVWMHLMQNYMTQLPRGIKQAASIGGTGVHVFFVCSGIGLYTSYLKHRLSFIQFIKKRFWKIYIPYSIIILLSACFPFMYNGEDRLQAVCSHIFLYKMFRPNYIASFGVQLWFISTMMQFYLLFLPLCIIKEKVKESTFLVVSLGISIVWWMFVYAKGLCTQRVYTGFCLQYLWEFAMGMHIAKRLEAGKVIRIKLSYLFGIAIIGIGISAFMTLSKDQTLKILNDIPAFFGYVSMALLLSQLNLIERISCKVSTISYELYLVHILVITTGFYIMKPNTLLQQLIVSGIAFLLCIIVSLVYARIMKQCYQCFYKRKE